CWPHFRLVSFALQPDYGFSIYTLPETVRFGQVRPQAPRPKDCSDRTNLFPAWPRARFPLRSMTAPRSLDRRFPAELTGRKHRRCAHGCVREPAAWSISSKSVKPLRGDQFTGLISYPALMRWIMR